MRNLHKYMGILSKTIYSELEKSYHSTAQYIHNIVQFSLCSWTMYIMKIKNKVLLPYVSYPCYKMAPYKEFQNPLFNFSHFWKVTIWLELIKWIIITLIFDILYLYYRSLVSTFRCAFSHFCSVSPSVAGTWSTCSVQMTSMCHYVLPRTSYVYSQCAFIPIAA